MLVVTNPRCYFRHDGTLHGPAQVIDLDDKRAKQLADEGKVQVLEAKSRGPKAAEEAQQKYQKVATALFKKEFGTKAEAKVAPESVAAAYGQVPQG